jgi:hypothetical protein
MKIQTDHILVNENEFLITTRLSSYDKYWHEIPELIFGGNVRMHRMMKHFNFAARTVKSIHNTPSHEGGGMATAMTERAFSEFDSLDEIKDAYAAFKAAGGKARPALEEWFEDPRPIANFKIAR